MLRLPHKNPPPAPAIARIPSGMPTPSPIAVFVDESAFPDTVAVTVAVALELEEDPIGTKVGLMANIFSSVQQSLLFPQQ